MSEMPEGKRLLRGTLLHLLHLPRRTRRGEKKNSPTTTKALGLVGRSHDQHAQTARDIIIELVGHAHKETEITTKPLLVFETFLFKLLSLEERGARWQNTHKKRGK